MLLYEWDRSKREHYLYHQFDINLNFPLHLHHSFEYVYVEEGELLLTLDGRELPITSGEAAVIAPEQLHSYYTPVYAKSYLCVFSTDYCYDLYVAISGRRAANPVFRLEDPEVIANLSAPGKNIFSIKSALYSIAGQFLTDQTFLTKDTSGGQELLEVVITWLQKHFREPITMKDLAEYTGYHYNYLSTWLHKHMKMNFSELVNEYRVNLASELLLQTNQPITTIAVDCGFETVRTFNRNFLQLRGKTPSAFRRDKQMQVAVQGPADKKAPQEQ